MSPAGPTRADRRRLARRAASPAKDATSLRARIAAASLKGTPPDIAERARKILLVYVDTAIAKNMPYAELAASLGTGLPAFRIGAIALQQQIDAKPGPLHAAACRQGCAFCCILSGTDGGVITEHEARTLHQALAPLAGRPDGRAWHPRACPALDPESRACRAYDARPMICRAYASTDAGACEQIAAGQEAPGAGVLSEHLTYLAAHGLARIALEGVGRAPTYSLARIAAAAVDGQTIDDALQAASHPPRTLKDERARLAGGFAG
jgi:Fe-S-cluster containining protein